jgi:hypothetical protein
MKNPSNIKIVTVGLFGALVALIVLVSAVYRDNPVIDWFWTSWQAWGRGHPRTLGRSEGEGVPGKSRGGQYALARGGQQARILPSPSALRK